MYKCFFNLLNKILPEHIKVKLLYLNNKIKILYDSLPKKVRIDASTFCQLNCKSCYMRKSNFGTMGRGYLKFTDFRNFIQNNKFIQIITTHSIN